MTEAGVDPWLIPVGDDKSPDVPKNANLKDERYKLSYEQALARLENGKNVAGYLRDELVVMDVDDPKRATKYIDEKSTTLTISSRSGKEHRYFLRGDATHM